MLLRQRILLTLFATTVVFPLIFWIITWIVAKFILQDAIHISGSGYIGVCILPIALAIAFMLTRLSLGQLIIAANNQEKEKQKRETKAKN